MATKISITLTDEKLAAIKKRIAKQRGRTVASYIQRAIEKSLENSEAFDAMMYQSLLETGGPITPKERAWAKKMLTPRKRSPRRRAA